MASQASEQQVQQLYIAYFGRPADPAGLAFYADALDAGTTTVEDIATSFGDSAEAQQLINTLPTEDFIDALYMQAFARPYDEALDGTFWIDAINSGATTKELAFIQILQGAQGDDILAVNNKVEVAQTFTQAVDAGAYTGPEAIEAAQDLLDGVTADPATVITGNQEAMDLAEAINNGTLGDPVFTLNSPGAVTEGETATFTLVADGPVDEDTTVTFQLIANGQNDTNTTDANTADFVVGAFTEVTVTIPAGQTTATFDVQTVIDQVVEQTEGYTVVATVNGIEYTATGTIDEDGLPQQDIILTAGADEVTPDSNVPGFQTTAGDDTIFAGSVEGGGAHTLGAADILDGGDGNDTLRIIEDRNAMGISTLFPNMENVENVLFQALTAGANIDFTNTNGIENLVNDRSTQDLGVDNLNDDARFVFTGTQSNMDVDYSVGAMIDNEVDVQLNNSNGASLTLDGAENEDVDTLSVEINGEDTTIGMGTFNGLNTMGNLANLNLTGDANVTVANLVNAPVLDGLFADLTNVDASMLEGTLNINILGNNNDITFLGAIGDTSLVIGQGDNTVTMQDGDDLIVLSSTGFDTDDNIDFAGGNDTLEIHFNDTFSTVDTLDDAGDGVIAAINNTMNGETLIVDVWNQANEEINLDVSLIDTFTNYVFDDTFDDNDPLNGANVQDLDLEGDVNVTNVTDADSFSFATDQQLGVNSFTAAMGASTLNVGIAGSDAAEEGVNDNDFMDTLVANGFATVNLDVQNELRDDPTDPLTSNEVDTVGLDDNATLNITGATGVFTTDFVQNDMTAEFGATVDASGLETQAGIENNSSNLFTFDNGNGTGDVSVIATGQNDTVITGIGNDTINGGAGNDILLGNEGDDTIMGGDGDDVLIAGVADLNVDGQWENTLGGAPEGVDNLSGGAGDDLFVFKYDGNANNEGLTSADIVDGGEGNDTVQMSNSAILNDQIFNGWSSIENLQLFNAAGNQVTINTIANNVGLETILDFGDNDDVINVGEGFTNDLTVDLRQGTTDGGDDFVNGSLAPGAITVQALDTQVTAGDTFTLGTSANDVLEITANGGSASIAGLSNTETINLISTEATAGADTELLLGNANAVDSVGTLTIDATGLMSDGLNTADALIDMSENQAVVAMGSNFDITGGVGNDTILGNVNADIIDGGAGNDTITGGGGADTLTGGEGDDAFIYTDLAHSSGSTIDTITDFESGMDRVVVTPNLFTSGGLPTPGATLNFAGNFASFGAAQGGVTDGDGIIDYVFQQDTNTLWVDLNDDGTLNADDIQINLDGVNEIAAGDVFSNLAPIANNDMFTIDEDTVDNVFDVTANDNDPEGDPLTLVGVGAAANGTVTVNGNNVLYTPDADYFGTDQFTYTVTDGLSTTQGVVDVQVDNVPDAPVAVDDFVTTDEDAAPIMGDVFANDIDVDGDMLTNTLPFAGLAGTDGGLFAIDANGNYTFDVNGEFEDLAVGETRDTSVSYFADDGTGTLPDIGTLTVTVEGRNDAPVTVDVAAGNLTEEADGMVSVTGDTLMGNVGAMDVDNGAMLSYTVNGAGTYGTFTIDANGDYTYTLNNADLVTNMLNAGDVVVDTVSYTATDEFAATSTSNISVVITGANDSPVLAGVVTGMIDEDAVPATVSGDADNTDVDNTDDTYTVVAAGAATISGYGTYETDINGNWIYTIDNGNGTVDALNVGDTLMDTFNLETEDGTLQTVTITINGANDPISVGPVTLSAPNQISFTATDPDNMLTLTTAVNGSTMVNNGLPTTIDAIAQAATQVTLLEVEADNGDSVIVGDFVQGTNGSDTTNTSANNTFVFTFGGMDSILLGRGDNIVDAGADDDMVTLLGNYATGAYAGDIVNGESIDGLANNTGGARIVVDTLDGGMGSDTLTTYGAIDITGATIVNFEAFVSNSDVIMTVDQFNAFAMNGGVTFEGDEDHTLTIVGEMGDIVDLSAVTLNGNGDLTIMGDGGAEISSDPAEQPTVNGAGEASYTDEAGNTVTADMNGSTSGVSMLDKEVTGPNALAEIRSNPDMTGGLGDAALYIETGPETANRIRVEHDIEDVVLDDVTDLSFDTYIEVANGSTKTPSFRLNIDADGDLSTTDDKATLVWEAVSTGQIPSDANNPALDTWETVDMSVGKFWMSANGGNYLGNQNDANDVFRTLENWVDGPTVMGGEDLSDASIIESVEVSFGTFNGEIQAFVDNIIVATGMNEQVIDYVM